MSGKFDRPSADLARRHALKVVASTSAKFAALSALSISALSGSAAANGEGRGWGWGSWGRGKNHGHKKGGGGSASCFLRGTRISTDRGPVAIEDLRIGDAVVTADRGARPIKWIGYRSFRRTEDRNWEKSVRPVRVAAGAIDGLTPQRDVFLSGSHAVNVDGHLMPVVFLINGMSIDWADVSQVQSLDYFHIELDTHEVIFAEGLPAETFFAAGREQFSNFAEYARLYGTHAEGSRSVRRFVQPYRGRTALKGLLAYAASPVIKIDDPMQRAYDRIAARARGEHLVA